MRSGYVDLTIASNIASRGAGFYEDVWAHHAVTWSGVLYPTYSSTANNLYFSATVNTSVGPSNTNLRWYSFSLRCLSTAVEGEERNRKLRAQRDY